ncbi:HECT-type E3 ubiquitin transferase [Aphelenchoides besseyi]|nr:HECT-type E3 ubiquitin transferase [Aphelenchoides besseyi]
MLINKSSLKQPFTTELPAECNEIIKSMLNETTGPELLCYRLELLTELCGQTGKVEFSQYFEVLNMCDSILAHAIKHESNGLMKIDQCDLLDNVVIAILKFTAALFENTFFRSVYASFLEVVELLNCIKPKIVVHTLKLLVSISKTSRFISQHVDVADQRKLSSRLIAVHECWSRNNTPTMAEAVKSRDVQSSSKITVRVNGKSEVIPFVEGMSIEEANRMLRAKLNEANEEKNNTADPETTFAFAQLRFNFYMTKFETRVDSAIQRLMSLAVLFYSRCLLDEWRIACVISNKVLDDICEVIQLDPTSFDPSFNAMIDNLRTEALKTLASIIFLDKPAKLQHVLSTLGLNSYLGYAATLMQRVVRNLKQNETSVESTAFITSLFSLIYHIAGLEHGGPALVSISTVPTLLEVVSLNQLPDSLISFATRAVRIIDILTHIDLNEFISHDGITIVVSRLIFEVEKCREFIEENEQPANRRFVIHHHRSALIKSLLNFLKRAIADPINATHARRIMEGDLPKALTHILKTPQYYGSSLMHCAVELTTMFIYQEPAQLNMLQDRGLSHAILDLLNHDHFPISREIVTSLPTTCSALCLNDRGLKIFNEYKPMEQIFRIIFSSAFMQVLRKRKNELNDAATRIGGAFDELMRHQPTLRKDLITSMVKVISELVKDAGREEIHISSKSMSSSAVFMSCLKSTDASSRDSSAPAEMKKKNSNPDSLESMINEWKEFSESSYQKLRTETEQSRRTHLVAEASIEKPTAFSFVQEGNYLPINDFMVLLVRMVESMLGNSTVTENSNVMYEAGLPEQILGFLSIERLVPVVSNPIYLHAVPNVFRLIFQQSRSLHVFELLSSTLQTQLKAVKVHDDLQQFIAPQHSLQLNRLSVLMAIFSSFIRGALANYHDTRNQLFHYLAEGNGVQFMGDLLDVLYKVNRSIAHFHSFFNTPSSKEESGTTETKLTDAKQTKEQKKDEVAGTSKSDSLTFTPDPTSNTALVNISKQLAEVLCQLTRALNVTRHRRGTETSFTNNLIKVAKLIFEGFCRSLDKSAEIDNRYIYIQNIQGVLRRLLLDENVYPQPLILTPFYESGCHDAFFRIGENLVKDGLSSSTSTLLIWLSTVHRLVAVESMQQARASRGDRFSSREQQALNKYMSTAQNDALNIVGNILSDILKKEKKLENSEKSRLLESVFDLLKELIQGIFQLHNTDKPKETRPSMDSVASEIDQSKVNTLTEMGFTRQQALQALALYTNVADAMDHLLNPASDLHASAHLNDAAIGRPLEMINETQSVEQLNQSTDASTETAATQTDGSQGKKLELQNAVGIDFQKSVEYMCKTLVPLTTELLAEEPAIVFAVADMLRVLIREDEVKEWSKTKFVQKVFVDHTEDILNRLVNEFESVENELTIPFASHLHLICLLWNAFDETYVDLLESHGIYKLVYSLLVKVVENRRTETPLLAPLLLWIDLYKKEGRLRFRRQLFNNAIDTPMQWYYWSDDDRSMTNGIQWREYAPVYTTVINAAFKAGRSECKLKINEKYYVIEFATMTQRLIDRPLQCNPIFGNVKLPDNFSIDDFINEDLKLQNGDDSSDLIDTVVKLFKLLSDAGNCPSDVTFSLLSLVHRLTVSKSVAQRFIDLNGVETMLHVRCENPALLMSTVICLILRNCVHNENLTRTAIEHVIRQIQLGLPASLFEQSGKTMTTKQRRFLKDWRRVLRLFFPLCDHDLPTYVDVASTFMTHRNEQDFQLSTTYESNKELSIDHAEMNNLKTVMNAILNQLIVNVKNPSEHKDCVLQPSTLILFISELIRSFPLASEILLDRQEDDVRFLQWIIEKLMLNDVQNTEQIVTCNALFLSLMTANSSPKCCEILVEILQNTLTNLVHLTEQTSDANDNGKQFCDRINTLTKFMAILRDCCTNNVTHDRIQSTFIHVVHDRNLLLDFAHAIRRLPLDYPHVAETANSVLRMMEEYARSIGIVKPVEHPKLATPPNERANTNNSTAPAGSSNNADANERPLAGSSNLEQQNPAIIPLVNRIVAEEDNLDSAEIDESGDPFDGFNDAQFGNRARSNSSESSSSGPDEEMNNEQQMVIEDAQNMYDSDADREHVEIALDVTNENNESAEFVEDSADNMGNGRDEMHEDENDTEMETESDMEDEEEGTIEDDEAPNRVNDIFTVRSVIDEMRMDDMMNRDDFFHENGLLQIQNETYDGGMLITNRSHRGDFAHPIAALAEYLNEWQRGPQPLDHGNEEVVTFSRGGTTPWVRYNNQSQSALSNGPGTFGTLSAASRSESHPLLRRPPRIVSNASSAPVSTQNAAMNGMNGNVRETVNIFISDRNGPSHPMHSSVLSTIENAINAIGAFGGPRGRLQTHRFVTHRSGHHHGLRRHDPRGISYSTPRQPENADGQLTNIQTLLNFSEEQGLMRALEEPRDNPFLRRIAELFVPFFMDRLSDTTRMLNAQSAQYINVVIAAHLNKVCKLSDETNVEPETTNVAQPAPSTNESMRPPDEEEGARSVDQASVDSSELALQIDATAINEPETDGERTPQNEPEISNDLDETVADEEQTVASAPIETQAVEQETPRVEENPEEMANEGAESLQQEEESADESIGIDPTFLAALPDDIRQELIRDHERQRRLQRLSREQRRQRQQSTSQSQDANVNNDVPPTPAVNTQPSADETDEDALDPDFMAALPPEIQEEVLLQHERRIAERAAQNAAVQQQANAPTPAADAIALLDSLAPSLRAQVLAEADESVLQILPENLVAEASRMRQNLEHDEILRAAGSFRHNHPPEFRGWRNDVAFRNQYSSASVPPASIVQILDSPSIATLSLLYFFENERFQQTRAQRVLKVISMHPGTSDFVIRSMLSLIKAASTYQNIDYEEDPFVAPSDGRWTGNLKVQTALNSPERALVVNDNNVFVHDLSRVQLCTRALETLNILARQSGLSFFNTPLRYHLLKEVPKHEKPQSLDAFWDIVRKIDASAIEGTKFENSTKKELSILTEVSDVDIRNCPFGLLLDLCTQPPICNTPTLLEKAMRIFHVTLSVPANTASTKEIPLADNEETKEFLLSRFKKLILSVLDGYSCEESLREFRNFFVQLLYAFPSLRFSIFAILFDVVREQGIRLTQLLEELRDCLNNEKRADQSEDSTMEVVEKRIPQKLSILAGSSQNMEATLDVVTTRSLRTSKRNQPKQLLRSLNIVSYLRNQLTEMYKRRKQSDTSERSNDFNKEALEKEDKLLFTVLDDLDSLWEVLSFCLEKVSQSADTRMLLSLQYAAEAFFLLHALAISAPGSDATSGIAAQSLQPQADESDQPSTSAASRIPEAMEIEEAPGLKSSRFTKKILSFAEKHRTVLNQILRSSYSSSMENSAFAVLTYFPKLLDFDVKRKYFYKEIKKLDDRTRFRRDDVAVRIRRNHLFSDSYRELFRLRTSDWKSRFYIIFEGEEGQDAGGLLREWYSIITREVFNPNYALFITAPGDGVTYMINKSSHVNPEHLDYFKFVGRIIAKAIYDNKQLDCYFTRAFYKQILNLPVRYQDIESEDPDYFKNLKFLLENPIENAGVDLNFNLEVEEFGVRSWRELKEGGTKIAVTDENKEEYVKLVCQMKMTGAVRKQIDAFLAGFYEIIPRKLISIFNEQELELLISGLPDIDIDDLYNNTDYKQYTRTSPQIQWFWRALRSFEKADLAKFLQFVTGTSKVPLQGFAHLEGMNGAQKFTIHMDTRSNERLPCAHTCFNQLDLPQYENFEQLHKLLLTAVRECTEGFAFA